MKCEFSIFLEPQAYGNHAVALFSKTAEVPIVPQVGMAIAFSKDDVLSDNYIVKELELRIFDGTLDVALRPSSCSPEYIDECVDGFLEDGWTLLDDLRNREFLRQYVVPQIRPAT